MSYSPPSEGEERLGLHYELFPVRTFCGIERDGARIIALLIGAFKWKY